MTFEFMWFSVFGNSELCFHISSIFLGFHTQKGKNGTLFNIPTSYLKQTFKGVKLS